MEIQVPYRLVGHEAHPAYVATFSWSERDPAAVKATFRGPGAEPVEWFFSRELLFDGISSVTPVGLGDVKVRRCPFTESGQPERFEIAVSSPEGNAAVILESTPVQQFLVDTESALPTAIFQTGEDQEQETSKITAELDYAIEAILSKAESEGA